MRRRRLATVQLEDYAERRPSQLSGGQQQRVAIARALVNRPNLVLADEPTGNLDSKVSAGIMALFQSLNDAGITVLFVTHEPYIAQHAKRRIVLRDGEVLSDAPVTGRTVAAPAEAVP